MIHTRTDIRLTPPRTPTEGVPTDLRTTIRVVPIFPGFYMITSAPEQNQLYTPSIQQLLETVSLYLHIPFCHTRCYYCDFNTYAGMLPLREPYVRALLAEIALDGELAQH